MAIQARAVQQPLDFRGYVVLLSAYAIFYLFMAGWMALHLGVMVGNMNEFQNLDRVCDGLDEACRGLNYNNTVPSGFPIVGLAYDSFVAAPEETYVGMGMPAYSGFFQNSFTTANEASGVRLSPDPWNANEKFATRLSANHESCADPAPTPGIDINCAVSGQIRINNNWGLRTTYSPVNVSCKATQTPGSNYREGARIKTAALFNPWNVAAGAFEVAQNGQSNQAGEDVTFEANAPDKDLFSLNWTSGHVFPHIAQFVVIPDSPVPSGETWSFTLECYPDSLIEFENNRMTYAVSFTSP
jgi:hypothetical protein